MRDTRVLRIWLGIAAFSVGLHGTIPLAETYRREFGASTGDLTLLYSLYAFALIPALIVFGTSSDAVGRRAIVLPSMALTTAASLVLAAGHSLGIVFAARAVQGWATGMFWGAACAFVLDHVPADRRLDASLALSATFMGSIAVGVFAFGSTASLLDSATQPWLLHAVVMVVAIAVTATVPETRRRTGSPTVTVALPEHRHRPAFFGFVAPVTFGLMGLGAYVVALGPDFVDLVLPGSSTGIQGAAVALMLAAGAMCQLATRRLTMRRVTAGGALLIPVGGAVLVTASSVVSLPATVLGMTIVGAGMGLSFRGLFAISEQMTTPDDRAGVISTFSIIFYAANAIPVVTGGYAVAAFGLAPVTAAATVGVAALVGGAHVATRRRTGRLTASEAYVA